MPTEHTEHGNTQQTGPDWAAWLQRYSGKLYFYAVHWNAEDPEDALQHTMVNTARAVAEGRCPADDATILRYAFTTLRNRLHRMHSVREMRRSGESAWGAELQLLESTRASNDECLQVQEAVRKLPPEEGEIVVLHLWEEMSFLDIAEFLGINRHTVSKRYCRALTNIRKHLTLLEQ